MPCEVVAELLLVVVTPAHVRLERLRVLGRASSRSPAAAPSGTTGRSTAAPTRSTRTGCRAGRWPRRWSPCSCACRRPTPSEHRRRAHHGDVVLARLDLGVGGGVGVQLRVVEVDHDLAAGETATARLAVQVLRRALDGVLRALEQVRHDRVVDVGDDRDVDLLGGDPDVGRLRLLVARLRTRRRLTAASVPTQITRAATSAATRGRLIEIPPIEPSARRSDGPSGFGRAA